MCTARRQDSSADLRRPGSCSRMGQLADGEVDSGLRWAMDLSGAIFRGGHRRETAHCHRTPIPSRVAKARARRSPSLDVQQASGRALRRYSPALSKGRKD
jgi:hypothetical protein